MADLTDQKPNLCSQCPSAFTDTQQLELHLEQEHGIGSGADTRHTVKGKTSNEHEDFLENAVDQKIPATVGDCAGMGSGTQVSNENGENKTMKTVSRGVKRKWNLGLRRLFTDDAASQCLTAETNDQHLKDRESQRRDISRLLLHSSEKVTASKSSGSPTFSAPISEPEVKVKVENDEERKIGDGPVVVAGSCFINMFALQQGTNTCNIPSNNVSALEKDSTTTEKDIFSKLYKESTDENTDQEELTDVKTEPQEASPVNKFLREESLYTDESTDVDETQDFENKVKTEAEDPLLVLDSHLIHECDQCKLVFHSSHEVDQHKSTAHDSKGKFWETPA